jgi:hypothetical protein
MNKYSSNQAGITFWGLCFVLLFIGIIVLFTLRAFPLYNEKFQVISAIDAVVTRPDASELTTAEVRKYFLRNVQISNVRRFKSSNIREYVEVLPPEERGGPRVMHVKYESRNKLFSDLHLLMVFDRKKPLRGPVEGE